MTVSEVRPDGKETFVQDGWLKTIARKLDRAKSTLLEPVLSLRKRAIKPLPKGRFAKVTVPLYYEGHVYRKNSRIRVTIAAPGRRPARLGVRRGPARRTRPRWPSPTRRRCPRVCCCR